MYIFQDVAGYLFILYNKKINLGVCALPVLNLGMRWLLGGIFCGALVAPSK